MSASNREFAAATYPNTLGENGNRMANDSARLTIVAYQKRWATFMNQQSDKNGIPNKLSAVIDNIKEKGDTKKVGRSTVRLYKATACYGLTMYYLAKFHPNSDAFKKLRDVSSFKAEKGLTFDNVLNKQFFESLYEDIKSYSPPLDDSSGSNKLISKTSNSKAKTISKEVYEVILNSPDYSSDNYHLLRKFIELNSIIGLRPIEWFKVRGLTKREFDANASEWFDKMSKEDELIVSSRRNLLAREKVDFDFSDIEPNDSVILVENGKNSLGRAGIKYRVLYSKDKGLYKKVNEAKGDFLKAAQKVADAAKDSGDSSFMDATGLANVVAFERVMKTTQKQMYYIMSKDNSIKTSLKRAHNKLISKKKFEMGADSSDFLEFKSQPMKVPTLYSTRHQAVADAKKAGLDPISIAAMFGHSSIVTASRHYGKSASGRSGLSAIRPSKENIDSVISGMTDDQMEVIKDMKLWHRNDTNITPDSNQTKENNNNGFNF